VTERLGRARDPYQRWIRRNIFQPYWYTPNSVVVASQSHAGEAMRLKSRYRQKLHKLFSSGNVANVIHVVCY